jgi:GTP-binding protein
MRLDAEFVSSAFALSDCPRWNRAEVALAGRSNVGKSSLLNALTRHKHLARTSKTPGRTRCLNFFAVGEALALVDLPGFGYAKMGRAEASKIAVLMDEYLQRRANLAALVILVDARRGPEPEETTLAALCDSRGIDLIVVATKCDKLRRSEYPQALARFAALGVEPIMCSATAGDGLDTLRRRIMAVAGQAGRRDRRAADAV